MMSFLIPILFILCLALVVGLGMVVSAFVMDYDGSITLWRAGRAQRRIHNSRAVYYVSLGYDLRDAQQIASRELTREAEQTRRELDNASQDL